MCACVSSVGYRLGGGGNSRHLGYLLEPLSLKSVTQVSVASQPNEINPHAVGSLCSAALGKRDACIVAP